MTRSRWSRPTKRATSGDRLRNGSRSRSRRSGALLASLQGSALLIALPDILVKLHASFLTIMWILLGYLLITTALVPVIGRLADMFGRKNLFNAGFVVFTLGSLLAGLAAAAVPRPRRAVLPDDPGRRRRAAADQQHGHRDRRLPARPGRASAWA